MQSGPGAGDKANRIGLCTEGTAAPWSQARRLGPTLGGVGLVKGGRPISGSEVSAARHSADQKGVTADDGPQSAADATAVQVGRALGAFLRDIGASERSLAWLQRADRRDRARGRWRLSERPSALPSRMPWAVPRSVERQIVKGVFAHKRRTENGSCIPKNTNER